MPALLQSKGHDAHLWGALPPIHIDTFAPPDLFKYVLPVVVPEGTNRAPEALRELRGRDALVSCRCELSFDYIRPLRLVVVNAGELDLFRILSRSLLSFLDPKNPDHVILHSVNQRLFHHILRGCGRLDWHDLELVADITLSPEGMPLPWLNSFLEMPLLCFRVQPVDIDRFVIEVDEPKLSNLALPSKPLVKGSP